MWLDSKAVNCPQKWGNFMLLLTAVHGAKHLWSSPKWICDLAWAIHKFSDVNWKQVEDLARCRGGLRMLRVGTLLAASLFSAPLQKEWLASLDTCKTADCLEGVKSGCFDLDWVSRK